MSPAEFKALKTAALALPQSERAELVRDLLASLDEPFDADAAEAWDVEICRRIKEVEAGTAVLLDADKVIAGIKARLKG